MGRPFPERLLEPHAAFAQHLSVIGHEEHRRVIALAGFFQRVQNPPDLVIDIRDHAVIRMSRRHQVRVGDLVPVATMGEKQGL